MHPDQVTVMSREPPRQCPDVVREWRDKHPGEEIPDGHVLTQPSPATNSEKARGIPDRVAYYQYRHDRARRTTYPLCGPAAGEIRSLYRVRPNRAQVFGHA
jgi:hypothetical protein